MSDILSRLKIHKVTVSRTVDGHFLSLSSGVGEEDPGLTLDESELALHEIGHALDKAILERSFVSRSLSVELLKEAREGLVNLYGRFKAKRFGNAS